MGNIKFLNGEEQTAELQEKAEIRLDEPPAADRKEEQAAHVLFEDISKREVDAKHFRMSDGSFRAVYYGSPVHYYDENEGKYVGIDNTLTESGCDETDEDDFRGYVNRRGSFRVKLAENTDGRNLMAIEKDGYRLIWKLLGKKDRVTGETALASASARVSKANEADSGTGAELDRLNGEVRYDDFVPGCDLQYVVTPTGVKENIIVREKKEAYIFDFLLKTKYLNLELSEDGRKLLAFVERVDETTGAAQKEVIFDIPAPYMIDGAGNEGYDVTYELSRQRNGKYLFSIVADETWINAEGRVFPVTIDPAIEVNEFERIFVSRTAFNKEPGTTHITSELRYVGGTGKSEMLMESGTYARTYFKITLPKNLQACKINHVVLKLHFINHLKSNDEVTPFLIRKCDAVDIENPPFYGNMGEIIQYIQQVGNIEDQMYVEYDLTKIYKNGSTTDPRYACLIGYEKDERDDLLILEDENQYGYKGKLEIDYTLNRTLKSEEFQTNDVKRAGTHMVDLFTGYNKFIHKDNDFAGGNRLSLEISHVYNSLEKSNEYYTVSKGGSRTVPLGMGTGWKLNIQPFVFKVADQSSAYDNSLRYLYIDQNGDEISFARNITRKPVYDGDTITEIKETEEFLDEQGKKLRCYEVAGEIRIADDNGTILYFDNNELYKITDKNGDSVTLVKEACYGNISRVYDSLGHSAVFEYDAYCRLSRLTFSDGKVLTYQYNGNGCLTKICYPDSGATEFYYGGPDSIFDLNSVRDRSGYRLNVSYSDGKVSQLKDFACFRSISSNGVVPYTAGSEPGVEKFSAYDIIVYEKPGKKLLIRYQNNLTSVIAENGYAQNYQFNQGGFCECVYETKDELNAEQVKKSVTDIFYYKGFDVFDTYEVRPSSTSQNLLKDGSFEGSDESAWLRIDEDRFCKKYGVGVDGDYALSIVGAVTESRLIRQIIRASELDLSRGEGIIFSGFAKADSLPLTNTTKFRIYLALYYEDNSVSIESLDFDYTKTNWQFAAKAVVLNQNSSLDHITFFIDYSYNNGTAYFDKLQLCKGNAVCTRGTPRFYTDKDNRIFDIAELEKIKYRDTDHFFNIKADETVDVKKVQMTYLNIVAMQNNPGVILDVNGVIDTNVDDKKTFLVFRQNGVEYQYNLFELEYAASGMTEIINKSGTVRLLKRKDDQLERIEAVDPDGNSFFSTFEYDEQNRLKRETDFRGVVKEYAYTSSNYKNVSSETKRYGSLEANKIFNDYSYERNHYLSRIYDERQYLNQKELYTENQYSLVKDRLESVQLPNGQTISYHYDETNSYLLGISTMLLYVSPVNGAAHADQIGIAYSYQKGYLTEIKSGTGGITYGYEYDGFGNLIKTRINGVEVVSAERFADSTYSSDDENTFNYEEITLANGCKIKEIKNCKGDLICRKIREQTGVLNGESQYGAETESFRVVYRTDENGEVLSEISYTIDKMPAIDAGTPDDSSQWLYSDYCYDENGELRSVARRGYRAGSDSVCRDKGGRVSSEDYRFENGFVDQCYIYDYNQNDAGATVPDDRLETVAVYRNAGTELINTLKFGYDELGRVKSRKVLSPSGTELLEESYGYAARKAMDVCNNLCNSGSTNYLSTLQHKCRNETYTEFVDYNATGGISQVQIGNRSVKYGYDMINRLSNEQNEFMGLDYHFEYDSAGNIVSVYSKKHGNSAWETKETYTYQTKDGLPTNQLLSITKESVNGGGISTIYTAGEYDGVGNPCKYRGNVLKWKRGRILKAYGGNEYRYDGNGIRQEKRTAGGAVHKYYTLGGKILGEEVSENGTVTTYRYEYLGDRVVGLVKNNTEKYYYQYNAVGDIARICDEDGKTAARYEYDAWGNHRIYDRSGAEITYDVETPGMIYRFDEHIGRVNPFRYKGYYYDGETGLYYVETRYYDPAARRFVNADNVGIVATEYLTTPGGQNLYSYSLNNPVNYRDASGQSVTAVISVIWSVVKLVVSLGMLGLAVYGLVGAIKSFSKEPSWLNLLFVVIAVVGVAVSSAQVVKAVRGVVTAVKSLPLEVKQSPPTQEGSQIQGDCFVAGTKVRTENGYKKIEEIEVGEKVLAYDEKTGRQEYKRVVRLFRGETNEWYHIEVNGEEIRCTGNHPFYVKGKGYVKAKELTREDKLVLSDGKEVGTEGIRIERLEKPETKYNFEVEDFHTYYVTECEILVHNKCWRWAKGSYESAEQSLNEHYKLHGVEVGADNITEYFEMATNYADDVILRGKFIKNVTGATKNVQRYTLGDNYYIDIIKKSKEIISFGELW